MTEEPERELTPEEDARIRSLLASARADETVPDDVAARLDQVLAGLADDRTVGSPRRRRNTGRWLLGAAAASVAALFAFNLPGPLSTMLQRGGGGTSTATSGSAGAADKSAQRDTARAPSALATLRTDTFRRDVRRLLAGESDRYSAAGSPVATPVPSAGSSSNAPDPENGVRGPACLDSALQDGVVQSRDVLLDGRPALLEVFGVTDGSRVVRVVSCDGEETLASARIPAR